MNRILALILLFSFLGPALADQEAGNWAHVAASRNGGQCYARSVPEEIGGQRGSTTVFRVDAAGDKLVHALPWYSQEVHVSCSAGGEISLVQMGPWPCGSKASANDLALAFHHNGKLVRRYSTLDIVGQPDNVVISKSHYEVFRKVEGFVYRESRVFVAETHSGRRLTFDPVTGVIIATESVAVSDEYTRQYDGLIRSGGQP